MDIWIIPPYLFLGISILLGMWQYEYHTSKVRMFELTLALLAVLFFYAYQRLSLPILVILLCCLVGTYNLKFITSLVLRRVFISAVLIVILLLSLHAFSDLKNTLLYSDVIISSHAPDFSLYLNFDKGLASVLLFFILMNLPRYTSRKSFFNTRLRLSCLLIGSIGGVLCLGYILGLGYDPKLPAIVFEFMLINFMFTVIAEEAFFRGFMQNQLQVKFSGYRQGNSIALLITSVIFGLVHFSGGWYFVGLAFIASFVYGFVYLKTGSLLAAIVTHWGVNVGHFLLLTYPVPKLP